LDQEKYIDHFLDVSCEIVRKLDRQQILKVSNVLEDIARANGRLFILSVVGGAGNLS
jgi:hypothetical protein